MNNMKIAISLLLAVAVVTVFVSAARAEATETDVRLDSAIYSYSRSEGVFAGAAFDGAVLNLDEEANAGFYDAPGITLSQISNDERIQAPLVANQFTCMVARYTDTTQVC